MPATLLTLDEARSLTDPFHGLWLDAFRQAEEFYWGDFRESHPEKFAAMNARARADMINCLIVDRVRREEAVKINETAFFGIPVQVISKDGLNAFVRFKLLDRDMRPQNHTSGQQQYLSRHVFTEEQLELAGIADPPTILFAGYQLTLAQDGMSSFLVVCRHDGQHVFDYDIENPAMGTSVIPLPIPDLPPALPRIASKIRKAEEEEDAANSDPE